MIEGLGVEKFRLTELSSLYKVYLFIYSAKTEKIKSQHICNNTMIFYQKYTYQIWWKYYKPTRNVIKRKS